MRESSSAKSDQSRDHLGCSRDNLKIDQSISNGKITFLRKSAETAPAQRVMTLASHRGYLIGLSAVAGHRRRIFHEHHSTVHDFEANSVYVRNFSEDYRADLRGSFDFLLLQIGEGELARMADEADIKHVRALDCGVQSPDPVLGGLLGALFCSVEGEGERSALFVDQISVAIGIHLVQRYGHAPETSLSTGRKLSARAKVEIKEQMSSCLNGQLSIAELAQTCNLSTGVFLQAFRESMGKTPQQWLTQMRIEKAMQMMLTSNLTLKEVAAQCGFSDQSHFTRVFSRVTGATPLSWRRVRQF
ncbi:AraC family transcriptional regulator [Rhizobium sp.]|jgi:AraC family transcriptional regulator|uniref:helix-turn-helix domain-containing protein n=1 Tax=Rhizobium sp. TaxID=391 RepID=UPI000E91308A|nr:AraC family transcriptional regulator [Rhizobium sp.]